MYVAINPICIGFKATDTYKVHTAIKARHIANALRYLETAPRDNVSERFATWVLEEARAFDRNQKKITNLRRGMGEIEKVESADIDYIHNKLKDEIYTQGIVTLPGMSQEEAEKYIMENVRQSLRNESEDQEFFLNSFFGGQRLFKTFD